MMVNVKRSGERKVPPFPCFDVNVKSSGGRKASSSYRICFEKYSSHASGIQSSGLSSAFPGNLLRAVF
jgi:hypothetical protein